MQALRKQKQENQKFTVILSYIVKLRSTWAVCVRPVLSLSAPPDLHFPDVETDMERPFTYVRLDPNHCLFTAFIQMFV